MFVKPVRLHACRAIANAAGRPGGGSRVRRYDPLMVTAGVGQSGLDADGRTDRAHRLASAGRCRARHGAAFLLARVDPNDRDGEFDGPARV